MKSLLEYLILEAKEETEETEETEENQLPSGYKEIDNRGAITAVAKQALAGESIKDAMVAATTADGKKQIREKLQVASTDRKIYGTINSIAKATNDLDELLKLATVKATQSGIEIGISDDWQDLARTKPSSLKLIKFWMKSALIAYGAPYKDNEVSYAFSEQNGPKLLIQLKSK